MTPSDLLLANLRACAAPARFPDFDSFDLTETDAQKALRQLERDRLIERVPGTLRYQATEEARYHVCRPAWPRLEDCTVADELIAERRTPERERSEAEKPAAFFFAPRS